MLIFTEYRDLVDSLVDLLKTHDGVHPDALIGQSSREVKKA